jgi:hypothetical protein
MNRQEKLIYAAGLFDGEGSISIAVDLSRLKKKRSSPHFAAQVHIAMIDRCGIEIFPELFGGNISYQKPRTKMRHGLYRWQASTKNASKIIKEMLPYLRVKRPQAEILLEFQKIKDRPRSEKRIRSGTRIQNTRWGPREYHRFVLKREVIEEMYELVLRLRQLNDTRFPDPLRTYAESHGLTVSEILHTFG